MKLFDEKYAELLVKKCMVNKNDKPLVIVYGFEEIEEFANLCAKKAREAGYKDVLVFNKHSRDIREYLKNTDLDDIKKNELLDRTILEEYAKRETNLLLLETTMPDFWKEVDMQKMISYEEILDEQLVTYNENTANLKCPWCVANYPNKVWAKKVYPDLDEDTAFDKLYNNIIKMCLCNKENPILEWDTFIKRNGDIAETLTNLKITKLYYKNKIGTNLEIYLPDNHIWVAQNEQDYYGNNFISNMPGFEIFTSPVYNQTEGTVYSIKPISLGGRIINPFGLEFHQGKVTKIMAKEEDKKVLNKIFERDEQASYLGECAIVEYDTPVNLTNTLYYELLYDENSSPHLALGASYPDTLVGGLEMSEKELLAHGLNVASQHVDFMIGTPDLKIEAETNKGRKLIFSKGKFTL